MTHAIVPPYLLARVAATQAPHMQNAARAAQATLAAPRGYTPGRSKLSFSVEGGDTLVAESVPAPDRTIFDAKNTETLPGTKVRAKMTPR